MYDKYIQLFKMAVDKIIDNIYDKISKIRPIDNRYEETANLYSTLIQAKIESCANDKGIYQDLKQFIKSYLCYKEEQYYGYDVINESKILNLINKAFSKDKKKKLALLKYAEMHMKRLGMPDNEVIIQEIKNTEYLILKDEQTCISCLKCALYFTSSSIKRILITTLLIFIFLYTLLLPAYNESFVLFIFETGDYANNIYVNHLFSLIVYIASLDDGVKVIPTNIGGVLLLSMLKFLYIIFVINYLFQHLLKKIKHFFE